MHGLIAGNFLFQIPALQRASRRHNRIAVYALSGSVPAALHETLRIQKTIFLTVGVIMCGLYTELAVFTTTSASAINNAAQIHPISAKLPADHICPLASSSRSASNRTVRSSSCVSRLPFMISFANEIISLLLFRLFPAILPRPGKASSETTSYASRFREAHVNQSTNKRLQYSL